MLLWFGGDPPGVPLPGGLSAGSPDSYMIADAAIKVKLMRMVVENAYDGNDRADPRYGVRAPKVDLRCTVDA